MMNSNARSYSEREYAKVRTRNPDLRGLRSGVGAYCAALCFLVGAASAQTRGAWQLTLPDGTRTVAGADADVLGGDRDFVLAERTTPVPEPSGTSRAPFTLVTTAGETLRVSLVKVADDELTVIPFDAAPAVVPIDAAVAIVTDGGRYEAGGSRPDVDVFTLANGDVVRGFLTGYAEVVGNRVGQGVWTVETEAGDRIELPGESVVRVDLADTGAAPEPRRGPRVRTAAGHDLIADSLSAGEGGGFGIAWRGSEFGTPSERVVAVAPDSGAVWLASLPPTTLSQTPFLSAAAPPRLSPGLLAGDGGPPSLSLLLHSRSVVAWELPERDGPRRLSATLRVDGSPGPRPRADADVRVLAGDAVVFERIGLTAEDGDVPVDAEVPADAATLTIEVDYGRLMDVQDRVVVERPVLLL